MQLSEIFHSAKFKIIEGGEHLWDCYGSTTHFVDFSGFGIDQNNGVSCVFDYETQQVYEVTIYTKDNKWYRWIDPNYIESYKKECFERNVCFEIAGEDNKWVNLENIEDVFRKVSQVIETGCCDNDVTIELNLDNDTLLNLCLLAHKRNITLNELVQEILQDAITKAENILKENKLGN